jgi:hypothetical protein
MLIKDFEGNAELLSTDEQSDATDDIRHPGRVIDKCISIGYL